MVIRRQAIHLLQDAEPDTKYEILNCAETDESSERGEAQPKDVDSEKSGCGDEYQMQILFGEDSINQPFDEQGIQEKHEAAQNNEGNTQEVRTHERAELVNKPAQLWIELRTQKHSPCGGFGRKTLEPSRSEGPTSDNAS